MDQKKLVFRWNRLNSFIKIKIFKSENDVMGKPDNKNSKRYKNLAWKIQPSKIRKSLTNLIQNYITYEQYEKYEKCEKYEIFND